MALDPSASELHAFYSDDPNCNQIDIPHLSQVALNPPPNLHWFSGTNEYVKVALVYGDPLTGPSCEIMLFSAAAQLPLCNHFGYVHYIVLSGSFDMNMTDPTLAQSNLTQSHEFFSAQLKESSMVHSSSEQESPAQYISMQESSASQAQSHKHSSITLPRSSLVQTQIANVGDLFIYPAGARRLACLSPAGGCLLAVHEKKALYS